jgi:hypothetical protein
MVTKAELCAAVDAAFEVTGLGLVAWPDPHSGRSPLDEEYSRVTDPSKWRIVGARADAWAVALSDAGLAVMERGAAVRWRTLPATAVSRTDRLVPYAAGALPLVIARSRIGDTDDVGVTLGVGDPAMCVTWIPHCGCDACDDGAQYELDQVDTSILAIVLGVFRRLWSGDREITVFAEGSWNATGLGSGDVAAVLAEPSGWNEVSGSSWLGEP